jgi:hypothetical protein
MLYFGDFGPQKPPCTPIVHPQSFLINHLYTNKNWRLLFAAVRLHRLPEQAFEYTLFFTISLKIK